MTDPKILGVRDYIRQRVVLEARGHDSPCWTWQRGLDAYGYGQAWFREYGKVAKVHRISYEAFVGPMPAGLVTDHLCRNRDCVNPDHLEPVTNAENIRRGRQSEKWTHCKRGHPLSGENIKKNRSCKKCAHIWYLENRERIVAKRLAARSLEVAA